MCLNITPRFDQALVIEFRGRGVLPQYRPSEVMGANDRMKEKKRRILLITNRPEMRGPLTRILKQAHDDWFRKREEEKKGLCTG